MNGYSTAAFGKYHETPPWEGSVSGPYDRWPTARGFDKFYGFIGGETNQWHPMVYDGTTRVYPKVDDPDYHFTNDMTDQALAWMNTQQSPDARTSPSMMYFATGATHAPHHAPKAYIDKYKGKFAQGWDKLREETLARQKTLGVVPQNTVLAPKPADIKDWDKLTRRREAPLRTPDGGVRRLRRTHRPRGGPAGGRVGSARRTGQHARSSTSWATTAPAPRVA